MTAEALATMARGVITVVFLVSLVGKLRDLRAFRRSVRAFRVVPRRGEPLLVTLVCGAELLVVVLTASGRGSLAGLLLALVVLGAFTWGITRVLRRGDVVSCGCFGPSSASLTIVHVARNLTLVAVAGLGALATDALGGSAPPAGGGGAVVVGASLAAAAVVLGALWVLDELAAPDPARPARPRSRRPERTPS